MGRAPCCDKANVKKGPWSPEEDATLKSYIHQNGTGGNWIALPQKIGLKRCGKSCRLRWLNYLRPNIKHGGFSEEEDNIICSLYISIGSRWSIIAAQLPGRTDNDVKNYWNTRLKKKLIGKQRREKGNTRGKRNSVNSKNIFIDHNNNPMVAAYEPQMVLPPIPYSNEEPRFNDHSSIRKLLIKLGGKFSNQNDNIIGDQIMKPPGNYYYNEDPVSNLDHELMMSPNYNYLLHNLANDEPGHLMNINGADSSLGQTGNFDSTIYENPEKPMGFEFGLYCDIINMSTSATTNIDWGQINSLVFPSSSSSHEIIQGVPTLDLDDQFLLDKISSCIS